MAGIAVDPNRVIEVYKTKLAEATEENILVTAAINQLSARCEELESENQRLTEQLTEPDSQG
jgi:prefoldin subunit 5